MAFTPAEASAAGGQIMFSGAVVEPTCSVSTSESTAIAAVAPGKEIEVQRLACAGSGNPTIVVRRMYALTAVRLSSSVPDPVLRYFDAYVKASRPDATDPVLLTQTYE